MTMRKIMLISLLVVFLSGCDSLRFAPSQSQKKNAWLHSRAAQMAADVAKAEETSGQLQSLTSLCNIQGRAFCADYGLPNEFPAADTVEDVLAQSSFSLADTAIIGSTLRPNGWDVADGAIDLGIGIAALFGGVYGTKALRFLTQTKVKTKALREIIQGNEFFKQLNTGSAESFKSAHKTQSPATRQVVTEIKNS